MFPTVLGEFIGTTILCAYGCSNVACLALKDSKGNGAGWVHVNWGWAFAVMLGAYTAASLGAQGDLNPAVTLFKTMAGIYSFQEAIAICAAELAGGICGGVICYLAYLNHWAPTEDSTAKLGVFACIPARDNRGANFLTEVIATFLLIFGIFTIVKCQVPGYLVPFLVGCLIYGLGSCFGGPTGYCMNPARDVGPRIAHAILPIPGKGGNDWGYTVVTIFAPIVGGVIAFFTCRALELV